MDTKIVKILIAVLLTLCLFDMPYWYYQLVRIFGTIGLAYLAWSEYKAKIKFTPIIFGTGAIIFNPIIKISFDRDTWNIVDIIFAIIIIATLILEKQIKKMSGNSNGE